MDIYDLRDFWIVVLNDTGKIIMIREDRHHPTYDYIEHILQPFVDEGLDVSLVQLTDRNEKEDLRVRMENRETLFDADFNKGKRNVFAEIKNGILDKKGMEIEIAIKHESQEVKDIIRGGNV